MEYFEVGLPLIWWCSFEATFGFESFVLLLEKDLRRVVHVLAFSKLWLRAFFFNQTRRLFDRSSFFVNILLALIRYESGLHILLFRVTRLLDNVRSACIFSGIPLLVRYRNVVKFFEIRQSFDNKKTVPRHLTNRIFA